MKRALRLCTRARHRSAPRYANKEATTHSNLHTLAPRSRRCTSVCLQRSSGVTKNGNKQPEQPAHYSSSAGQTFEAGSLQGASAEEEKLAVDLDYVKQHMKLPTKAEYPDVTASMFHTDTIPAVLTGIFSSNGLEFHREVIHDKLGFRATLSVTLPDGEEMVTFGHGTNKRLASKASHAHSLAKLHEAGILKGLITKGLSTTVVPDLDHQTLEREKDAKCDVYNYAARYGLIPQITARPASLKKRSGVEVTIELSEHEIKVSAVGPNVAHAEIAASIQFRKEAEKYHAVQGEDSIAVSDPTTLNINGARDFMDFYFMSHPGATFNVEAIQMAHEIDHELTFEARVLLNGKPLGSPVTKNRKKTAEQLAQLVGAVALTQKDTTLLPRYREELQRNHSILVPPKPIDMALGHKIISQMTDTVNDVAELGLPNEVDALLPEEDSTKTARYPSRRKVTLGERMARNRSLKSRLDILMTSPTHKAMRDKRNRLPMSQHREQVLNHVNNNPYSIIIGATGSGKTTQVPQILLDSAISQGFGASCTVICTQPRRIAATSVARRVADERGEKLKDSVGYQVRFDSKLPFPVGSITYCTTGILLQQLQHVPDELLDVVSHIIIDEVHERDIPIDFLMLIVKKTINARLEAGKTVPKVVLMSATVDPKLLSEYFEATASNGSVMPCPSLTIPGRAFPVAYKFLDEVVEELRKSHGHSLTHILQADNDTLAYIQNEEKFGNGTSPKQDAEDDRSEATIDWKRERDTLGSTSQSLEKEEAMVPMALTVATVAHIAKTTKDGAILVFLPGYEEIRNVHDLLLDMSPLGVQFGDSSLFRLSKLHSSVPAADQASIFSPLPEGCRRVILSTNIAETSVTIPDVRYVVDTGKLRELRYDQVRRITSLPCTWVSKSNVKQRAGRAGRVRDGNYYALYSRARYDRLKVVGLPEMLRSDLEEVCLAVKAQAFQMPIRDFLSAAIEPPDPAAVDVSIDSLEALGALTDNEQLTALGRLLSKLPVHPSFGKMIVLGIIFRCLDPIVIIGAALAERSPLTVPPEQRKEARVAHQRYVRDTASDHIALINAIRTIRKFEAEYGTSSTRNFCVKNFLHYGSYRTIMNTAHQVEEILVLAGVIPFMPSSKRETHEVGHPSLNKNSKSVPLIKGLVLAALRPNLATSRGILMRTKREKRAIIHPWSFNYHRSGRTTTEQQNDFINGKIFAYSSMKANDGGQIMLRDTSLVTPLTAALFGGSLELERSYFRVDDWLPLIAHRKYLKEVVEFRKVMELLVGDAFGSLSEMYPVSLQGNYAEYHSLPRLEEQEQQRYYLSEDEARETFTDGLVQILEQDSRVHGGLALPYEFV